MKQVIRMTIDVELDEDVDKQVVEDQMRYFNRGDYNEALERTVGGIFSGDETDYKLHYAGIELLGEDI